MASTSNSQVSKRLKTATDIDRISSLPDKILGHILSFLPPKDAVGTSILSTRWKCVFLHVHDIKLDDVFLQNPQTVSAKSCVCSKSQTTYIDYANQLLMLASGLRTFRLHSVNLKARSVANLWIRSSLTRNIQEIDIKVDSGRIPNEIFSCNPLVVMKIEGQAQLKVPKLVCLPNLRVMKLKHLTVLADIDTDWEFSAGYPQLEDLQLHEITVEDVYVIRISISTVQKLSLHFTGDDLPEGLTDLNAPNLCHLELEVGFLYWELPGHINDSPPLFGKLKFLELRDDYGFDMLESIFHNAPNLERLICNVCLGRQDAVDNRLIMQHLREVEVRKFGSLAYGGFASGLKMIFYFLQHGVLLKKITIVDSRGDYKDVFESSVFKKILLQSSCSPAVQLLYLSPGH